MAISRARLWSQFQELRSTIDAHRSIATQPEAQGPMPQKRRAACEARPDAARQRMASSTPNAATPDFPAEAPWLERYAQAKAEAAPRYIAAWACLRTTPPFQAWIDKGARHV